LKTAEIVGESTMRILNLNLQALSRGKNIAPSTRTLMWYSLPQAFLALLTLIFVNAAFAQSTSPSTNSVWLKGNTHTHTLNSDGDSSAETVVQWYREHGYNFVFITDHEYVTPVAPLNAGLEKPGQFRVFAGQEITDTVNKKPYHVNGLGLQRVVMPRKGPSVVESLQTDISNIRNAGAIAQINHPNFGWALTAVELKALRDYTLLEIFRGHPLINYFGGGGIPSAEQMWDDVLSSGKVVYGVASDDSHHFKPTTDLSPALPGLGWIVVRARELSEEAVLDAMIRGDFYASSGVELEDYTADAAGISLKIKEKRWSKYRTLFIGKGGRILAESITNPAQYKFRGGEGYVRAKIQESNGKMAWTQPVFLK
jgi:hypothetical protein